jgi:hypothetical protein
LIPLHLRALHGAWQPSDRTWNNSEPDCIGIFFAITEQHLHSDTDTHERNSTCHSLMDDVFKTHASQCVHTRTKSPNTGEDNSISSCGDNWVRCENSICAYVLKRLLR